MGIDLCFNKQAAIAAGLITETRQRGSEYEVQLAIDDGGSSYVDYLRQYATFIQVPNRDWWLDGGTDPEQIVVRANKWGDSYAPLTDWLKANGITWGEF